MKRFTVLLLALLLVTVSVASAQDEKVLVVGHAESTDSLDPARGYTQTTGIINHVTYETLVTFPSDSAGEILPLLATDWTISEDGLTYTFNLRSGVTFTNGDPLTADDVVFTVNRLNNVGGSPKFLTDNIASVVADDEDTVTFTLAALNPAFLSVLTNNAFGITNDAQVMENGGSAAEDAATADAAEEYLNGTSAGTGPYTLESWEKLVQTVLVRNESYWGTAPYFDRIIISNIPEASTQKVALESGEIDIALDLTPDQMPDLEGNADVTIASSPANIVHFLLMNDDPTIGGPMADPQVQQAVRLALDYAGYTTLWSGITPGSIMAVGQQYAFTSEQATQRNLDEARALLEAAGYADGFDITMDYPALTFQGVNMDTNAQKIQADLAEIGIHITLAPADVQVALEGYRAGTQAFAYWFWGPDILDPIDVLSFMVGGKVAAERANWTDDLVDPAMVELRDRAAVAVDPAEREEIFTEIQTFLNSSSPFAPFLQPNVQTVFASNLQGYVWHPQWLIDLAILSRAE